MRSKLITTATLVTAIFGSSPVWPAGIDLHRLWDDSCFECHGHAAEFSRRSLNVENGDLQGRHHVEDLRQFMRNHYLLDSQVDATYEMLLAQAGSQERFRAECSSCHDTAAKFVRLSMEFRAGVLYANKSGLPVNVYLQQHRDLNPDSIEFFVKVLSRVAREVYRQ